MDNADHIEQTIKKTFEDVVETGFDSERIQAILHRTELSLKRQVKESDILVRFSYMADTATQNQEPDKS